MGMRTLPFVPVWRTLQNRYRSQATGAHIQQPNSKPSSRIERWGLHLQPYNFTVVYKPGTSNITDYLSRYPFLGQPVREWNIAEQYVNYLVDNAVPKAMSLDEISNAFEADPTMRIVIPPSLQNHAVQLAHEGHQGIVKTKQLLRQKVWYL